MVLPVLPACEVDVNVVIEVTPVAVVVEARNDGLEFGEVVLHFIFVVTELVKGPRESQPQVSKASTIIISGTM
jgi:hypothetical protein